MFFEGKLGTFTKLQAISNWFGEDDTAGFVNSEGRTNALTPRWPPQVGATAAKTGEADLAGG